MGDILMSGQLCHVGQQSVRHGCVWFNGSWVRPGNVCHIGQQMSVMDLCFSKFHLYTWSFKPGRSTNCPLETCLFQPSFLPDILECIRVGVYLGYGMTSS